MSSINAMVLSLIIITLECWITTTATLSQDNESRANCPASHPYVFFYGQYCCKSGREKVYPPEGDKCDGSKIRRTSHCCQWDSFVQCPSSSCDSFTDWLAVDLESKTLIYYDLDDNPLLFKTSSLVGSNNLMGIFLHGLTQAEEFQQTVFWLYLSRPPIVVFSGCSEEWQLLNTNLNYSSEENEWMLWKTNSSISLDYNGELAFHINLSDFGEKCEEIGQWQIFWLNWFEDTNFDELQYKPNLRVDGGYSDWSHWSQCSAMTCEGGTTTRTRTCTNPTPEFGGAECDGDSSQTKQCNSQKCNVHSPLASMVNTYRKYQSSIKQIFYPYMKLEISSTFYFKMLFTGNYDRGCGFTFNIMDINDENIYHLDVRCNNKNRYRTMIQADKRNGKWSEGAIMKLPDLRKENDVYVSVTDKYFELTINSIEIKPKFATDLTRLSSFKYFLFYSWGNCIQLHAANSYMSNKGGELKFVLVDERNNQIELGKSSGLLLAHRAGSSQRGTICGNEFSKRSADIICRELGYRGADNWTSGVHWPDTQSNYSAILSDITCEGNSSTIKECSYSEKIPSLSCSNEQDVFLSCTSNNDTCKVMEHNHFLKLVCNDISGKQYFKCLNSDTYYGIDAALPGWSKFSKICEDDPKFYQVCGAGHDETFEGAEIGVFCGQYICQEEKGIYTSGYIAESNYSCDGLNQCVNTKLDEVDCKKNVTSNLPASRVCDGFCDRVDCEDESSCNGHKYGKICGNRYTPPNLIGYRVKTTLSSLVRNSMHQDCGDNDEGAKDQDQTCIFFNSQLIGVASDNPKPEQEVNLTNFSRCGAFKYRQKAIDDAFWINSVYTPYCKDFLDQTNCSDSSRIGLNCTVKGYPASLSKQILCHGISSLQLCEDGIENKCVSLSSTCQNLHKHKMCDNVTDCSDRSDEEDVICRQLTQDSCVRRFGNDSLKIPLAWLMDNISDCQNGIDEMPTWPVCGKGQTFRFVSDNSSCSDDYICHQEFDFLHYVAIDELCDGIDTCGRENLVCKFSRSKPYLFTEVIHRKANIIDLSYCQGGLRSIQLLEAKCEMVVFQYPQGNIFGLAKKKALHLPMDTINCEYLYGELYLYSSCAGRCGRGHVCPLTRPVRHDSCPGQYRDRTYTVVDNAELTFLIKQQGTYNSDIFVCGNNRCISYRKVCDLVDDCGDGSDESSCKNHVKCNDSENSYIAVHQQCDGNFDCLDLSDECNDRCGKLIIQSNILKILSWTIGILAVLLNVIFFMPNLISLRKCTSKVSLLNKLLILVISFGDFLVGIYLLTISIIDFMKGVNYCRDQKKWLTSDSCAMLGVISTVGSQLSLFSMTLLSITRMYGVRNSMSISKTLTKKGIIANIVIVLAVAFMAGAIAMIPLHRSFEDFFVNGLSYDPKVSLFAGFPDKHQLKNVLNAYYGRIKDRYLSWQQIIALVRAMFTDNYDGIPHKEVHFYGNDGVCLFKYFVNAEDPQRDYVWSILTINLVCFATISLSYIIIGLISLGTSRILTSGSGTAKSIKSRNQKTNTKIAIIIFTDFCCWVPFIIFCALHTLGVMDASRWYAMFSIVLLPINSVINPLLYNNTLTVAFSRTFNSLRNLLLQLYRLPRRLTTLAGQPESTNNDIPMTQMSDSQTKPESSAMLGVDGPKN